MHKTAVIMAGGGGTRFWPVSRMERPKQLVRLTGNDVMINETIKHYDHVIGRENTFIVTNEKQAGLMDEVLFDEVPRDHILVEPVQRNTAPCIIYAAMTIKKLYGDAVMAVLSADHNIGNVKEYERVLSLALKTAEEEGKIVTIGIEPSFPSTGYGYIRYAGEADSEVKDLIRFVEKPELSIAKEYVESGEYLWNSGMFIWKVSVILDYFKKLLPDMYEAMDNIYDKLGTPEEASAIASVYPTLEKVSVDYGIMEKAEGNIRSGDAVLIDCSGSVFFDDSGDKLLTGIGLKDTVVVQTKDAILVAAKDQVQKVKDMVDKLRSEGREDLL